MEEMDNKVEGLAADLVTEIVERKLANIDRGDHRRGHREQIEACRHGQADGRRR
jgi:hypothetical protein